MKFERKTDLPRATIVVIDDEPKVLEAIKALFSDLEVHGFTEAEEALTFIGSNNPDLVMLDEKMPGLSGRELYQKIREQDKKIAVVFHTAMPTNFMLFDELEQLSGYCIQKTENLEGLVQTVNEILGGENGA